MSNIRRAESISFEIDEELVFAWADLSGDRNLLHLDEEFAAGTRYGKRIAHGPILASLVSTWVAAKAGAQWAQTGRITFRFTGPVPFPARVHAEMILEESPERTTCSVVCRLDEVAVLSAEASWAGDR